MITGSSLSCTLVALVCRTCIQVFNFPSRKAVLAQGLAIHVDHSGSGRPCTLVSLSRRIASIFSRVSRVGILGSYV